MMNRRTYLSHSGMVIGGIFFSGSIITFLESCRVNENTNLKFKLLSEKEAKLLAALCDMIIPPTDIPGASDVGVEKRIDEALYCNFEKEDQDSFVEGLKMIETYTKENYHRAFYNLDPAEKDAVMQFLIQDYIRQKNNYRKHVYPLIKGLTIIAYFTSETIARTILKYDPIPGVFQGDIPYDEVNANWAINILDS